MNIKTSTDRVKIKVIESYGSSNTVKQIMPIPQSDNVSLDTRMVHSHTANTLKVVLCQKQTFV